MRAFPVRLWPSAIRFVLVCLFALVSVGAAFAQAQSNASDLQGYVRDAQGGLVVNAGVTARNKATGLTRTAQSNDEGFYQITNLPPGEYEVTVEAANFSRANIPSIVLTVGQRADLDVPLAAGQVSETVTISGATTDIVETSRTVLANTIDTQRIENLPVNQRDYLGIATTISTVNRGNDRAVGPAPSSGLNIGGQRGRSTLVQVDGADNTDNSINAARTTVSQEAVQEFQVATNSYAPEFGRAIGGIVNVVTKSGGNEYRGNIFGFLRNRRFQARNAFAPVEDPPFTRVQYGATIGGPIKRDRTFFFAAFEQRRRQESAFFSSDVGRGLTSSLAVGPGTSFPFVPLPNNFTNLTAAQAAFITTQLNTGAATGNAALIGAALTYATFASSGGQIGLTGASPLRSIGGAIPAGQVIGGRFFISGAPVPTAANNGANRGAFITVNEAGQPIGFRPLNSLARIFPISEATSFFSVRGDHQINQSNQLTMRFGYNPGDVTGIQDESQNQVLGQNDFSRTGRQEVKDTNFVTSLTSTLTSRLVNEARFSFGHRDAKFDSQVPGTAIQISGAAFIGSNPFSPVDRTERRFQFTDNISWLPGNHNFKFGADFNFVDVEAIFELNFPGLFNFGEVSGGTLAAGFIPGLPSSAPSLTPVQAYGAGIPGVFIQGFGNPNSTLKNKPIAFFAQDSWKVRPNLTLNYGLRYDVELTETIPTTGFTDPLSRVNLSAADLNAAQNVLGVQQGFPRDTNNFAPRVGLAWDLTNDGKTVFRAAYGLFYDHPLLAIAFNSDIADAAQQQQFTTVIPGSPDPRATLNLLQIFQGTVSPGITPGVASTAQYLPGQLRFNDQTFPGFGPILPFTLAVAQDFEYAYANQANVTLERQLTKNTSVSASYVFVGAHHLPHPRDVNAPQNELLVENFRRFAVGNPVICPAELGAARPACLANGRAPLSFGEAVLFPIPTASNALFTVRIPGLVAVNNVSGQTIVSPLAANFFRPNAPNYFFVQSVTGGAVTPAVFNAAIAGSVRTPGLISPFGDVSAQVSDGNSNYNAMTLEAKRRFSNNFQFLASYTWSHSIDDSSDLQTLLKPQDNRNFRAERSDSLFDQRHRFVFSGVATSPDSWRGSDSAARRFFADFTISPILELSSGRPFNIITGTDTNADLQSSNDRPSVAADGTLFVPSFLTPGNLRRNAGITHGYASLDMRVARAIRFGERMRLDLIAEGFNLFNRFNEAAANPFFDVVNTFGERRGGLYYSRPTAAYDARQFQFGLKFSF
ncbi:MAG TPA: TonB-dependent receptor [Pyrinomonadaceae bacterium]|nr:TonB-dependent receptor [Pyrinomonadaceae bacterium]